MQVDFYQLSVTPLDRALPRIAQRVLDGGNRLLVVTADESQRAGLDRTLWTFADDSFLPHGVAGSSYDADQPVLIASEPNAANGAKLIAIVDGEWRDEALGFDRALHFFDDDSVGAARLAWKSLAGKGDVERRYWKQNERGAWEQAA